jgi:putative FmdB family regulatory protein
MPLYEYYCKHCDGIFEYLRGIREASEPSPCPLCDRDAARIMPTSFAAFTFRDGMPRRIPDRGTYYHLGKEVKEPITGGGVAYEHPEISKKTPAPIPTKADTADKAEQDYLKQRHLKMLEDAGIPPSRDNEGELMLSPDLGASGHAKK